MKIKLHKNGHIKEISKGYSFKSLFFGCFYPAARGDFKGFFIQLALGAITGGLSWLVVPFTYNKIYLERLINNGWYIDN